jgi:hypothetical protein
MQTAPFERIACPPPTVFWSITTTLAPARAASSAALKPEMPAPTIATLGIGSAGLARLAYPST